MKINKLFFGLLAVAAMLFTACHENDDDDYKWASASGEQVFFSSDLASIIELNADANSFTIPLKRLNTSSAATVALKTTDESGLFTVPASVSFNAGQAETAITVGYDPSKFDYDDMKAVEIAVGEETYATPYGKNIYKFTAGVPSPLILLGTAKFEENYWYAEEAKVEIYQNTQNPNEFRIKQPFGSIIDGGLKDGWLDASEVSGNQNEWLTFTLLKPGSTLGDIEITQEDLVYFENLNSGYFNGTYGADVWLLHPAVFSGATEDDITHNRVLAYQENGLPGQVQLAPRYYMFGVGGWNQSANDGVVVITFPGYVPLDLEANIAFQGIFTNTSDEVFAVVETELGADAADVRAVVVPADADADAVADAVASGELEATPVGAGRIEVPIEEGLTGELQVVLVVLYEGQVKNVATTGFEYYGGGANPWNSLGLGLYTDGFFSDLFGFEPPTIEVEVLENSETPGLYRLVYPYGEDYPYNDPGDWDASSSYDIYVHAEDPNGVYIPVQPTGVDWGYGAISISSYGGYLLQSDDFDELKAAGYLGTLKNGIITIPTFEAVGSDGEPFTYEGIIFMGSGGYRAGNGFKLVLPEAVNAQAKAKAKSAAKGAQFAKRLQTANRLLKSKHAVLRGMNSRLPISKMELKK